MKSEAVSREQRRREAFFALISRHLSGLYRFVRHVLAYCVAIGELTPGDLTADDVVDAVVLRAYPEFAREPARQSIQHRLMELAREHVAGEVKRRKSWHERMVSKEEDIPETPPSEAVYTLGDEILDFFEPDEDLKLEDVIPDEESPIPEEQLESAETQWCVDAALAGMPSEWRRALVMRHVRGLGGSALARAVGKPAPEVQRILKHARQYLRQKLVESGCGPGQVPSEVEGNGDVNPEHSL